jgi:hypothetical protein
MRLLADQAQAQCARRPRGGVPMTRPLALLLLGLAGVVVGYALAGSGHETAGIAVATCSILGLMLWGLDGVARIRGGGR